MNSVPVNLTKSISDDLRHHKNLVEVMSIVHVGTGFETLCLVMKL